jgi:hypothetical protein
MKRSRTLIEATVLILLATGAASAQHRQQVTTLDGPTFEVRSDNGVVTIPFEIDTNHVIIPIEVRGNSFRVILDTGMPMSGLMLYGTASVEDLGLEYGPERVRVGGAGGEGKHLEARLAHGVTVDIEDVQMRNASVIVMPPLHHFHASHDGVIGYGLFKNFVVRVDYDKSVIELHDPDTFSAPESSTVVPLKFNTNFPYADIEVKMNDGKKLPLTVVVDIGASHAISLNVVDGGKITVPDDSIRTTIGKGVGGNLVGQVGRVRSLELGGVTLNDVVATFPDEQHQRPGGMEAQNGNLGNGLLRRFNVTFDYSRKAMLLEPNRRFDDRFEWDMSGMRLEPAEGSGLRIDALVADSPAVKAGLAIDDVVTHINDEPVSKDDLRRIREMMEHEGAVVRITATRDGRTLEAKLKLRRLV